MGLDNKHLRVMLSDSDMQGFSDDGRFVVYSPFAGIEPERAEEIFRQTKAALQKYFNDNQEANGGEVNVNAIGLIGAALDGVVLDGLPEILHFIWVCGLTYKSAEMKLDAMLAERDKEISEEQGSLIELAVKLENGLMNMNALIPQLPVPMFWPELGRWTQQYNDLLMQQRALIKSLM